MFFIDTFNLPLPLDFLIMATFLFDKIIFGPIKSRRLGSSLGVNLLPNHSKLCNYNCIYCECGWTKDHPATDNKFHSRDEVSLLLEAKLKDMNQSGQELDVITFAGNGEPTMHPNFHEIIDDTIALRNAHYPSAKIAVLSNASMIAKASVREALDKIDDNILKLDSAIEATNIIMNQPRFKFNIVKLIDNLKAFNGNFILQTMFLKGNYNSQSFDNTTEKEISAWIDVVRELSPKMVMIYTIARDTPHNDLVKIEIDQLNSIAIRVRSLGIEVQVSG